MRHFIGPLYLSAASAIWGGMYVVSKWVLTFIPAWVLVEIRFIISTLVLGIVAVCLKGFSIPKRQLGALAAVGLVGYTLSIGMQFVGTDLSGAAMGSLITAASPALISVLGWWLLRDRMTIRSITALLFATLGVIAVVGIPTGGQFSWSGNIALLGAAVTWALYTVLCKRLTSELGSLAVTLWASLFGIIFTSPLAVGQYMHWRGPWPGNLLVWGGVLYVGIISTAGAFYFWNKGFEYVSATSGSLFFFVQPMVGSALGAWLLHESLAWNFWLGAGLILAGLFVSARGRESSVQEMQPT